jgi:glycosyltransferase involved in cell wall biosynthesis
MRILIFNWRDIKHPLAGGAEISTHEHAKRWVKAGHQVIQFSSSIRGEKLSEVIDGVQIIRRGNHYTVHLFAFIYYLKYLHGKIDFIVDEFHFIPFFTVLYTRVKKMAFIHETAEEIWFKNQGFPINILGFILEPIFIKLYKNIKFMTVSRSTKRDLVRFGIPSCNIQVIHNGVKIINSQEDKEESPTLICLGRLAKDKGTEEAISVFCKVQEIQKNSKLWIVGREESEGYENKLKNKVVDLHIAKKVIFYSYVSEEKKFDLLKRSWILINLSVKEGWGLTVMEAASQGTPTIAYDTSGLRDSILNGKTGLLVYIKTQDAFVEKITMLLNSQSLCKTLSKNAVEWSGKFDWNDSAKKSLLLINNIYESHT